MPSRSEARRLLLLAVVLLLVAIPSLPAVAERTQSNFVLIRSDVTVPEDLYAAGNVVDVDGVIEGDLVAAAFSEVRVDGEVQGSVTAIASRVVVTGRIGGSLRTVAREVVVEGAVAEDLVASGWTIEVADGGEIGRDAFVWGWTAEIAGSVARDLEGQQRSLELGAEVGRDVDVTVTRLVVGPGTTVNGDLGYRSEGVATISDEADIGGAIVHKRPMPANVRVRALQLLGWFLAVLAALAIGLTTIWSAPDRSQRAGGAVRDRPVAAVAWGLALIAIAPGLAAVTGLAVALTPAQAGLPLLLLISPLVIAAFSLLAIALLAAPVPVASAVGFVIAKQRSPYAAFVIGLGILTVLSLLPWVGVIVLLLAAAAGLGGWLLSGEG